MEALRAERDEAIEAQDEFHGLYLHERAVADEWKPRGERAEEAWAKAQAALATAHRTLAEQAERIGALEAALSEVLSAWLFRSAAFCDPDPMKHLEADRLFHDRLDRARLMLAQGASHA